MDVVMGDAEVERMQREAKAWPLEQLELLRKVLQNVVENPKEPKFRKLKTGNARIAALLALPAARSGLEALGWQATEEALELPERAELAPFASVLEATKPQPLGELVPLTVLRGALKSKLELPCNLPFSGLAAALEQSDALGRIPRARQRLLVGVPPKPLSELWPNYQAMTIEELNLKAFKLEDTWEEMVADLRALRASFGALLGVLSCKRTLQDNYGFLLDSAKALLQAKAKQMDATELQNARKCFAVLWPPGAAETRQARLEHCAACTPLSAPQKAEDGSVIQFPLRVERAELFDSAISQIASASAEELRRPLQVTFANEAAEDAGGPRREFFNDFGRACAEQTEVWQLTAAGSLLPAECASSLRGCGRVCGLALCQAENAAQEQRVRENATLQELLAAVTEGEEGAAVVQQKLLLGAPLARPFLRCVQADAPETLEDLQAELNAEQHESAPDFRGAKAFLSTSLRDMGLEGQLTFSRQVGGRTVDLTPGGRDIVVTEETKLSWLRAVLKSELVDSLQEAAESFRLGVLETCGAAYLALLSAAELQEEWSGLALIKDEDLKLWRERAAINPARKAQADWFFEILAEEPSNARPKVLKFTTGSDRWPSDPKTFAFYVEPMDGGDEVLPRAMTCGNMLQLPNYSSKEQLRSQLAKACELGLSMQLV